MENAKGFDEVNSMLEFLGTLFPENTTFTVCADELTAKRVANITVEENEDSWEFIAPLPGVKKEEINISFKNDVMTITNEDSEFCTDLDYSFEFDYNVEVDMVEVFLEDGVLHVIVDKPEDVIFTVEIK
jgi:HSP20 family molecular chaperone IbpA